MFAIPGIIGLVVFLFARPLDLFESLRAIPFLYIFLGVGILGMLLDLRLGFLRIEWSPLSGMVAVFLAWCVIATLPRGVTVVTGELLRIGILSAVFVVMAHGIRSLRGLSIVMGTILLCLGLMTTVGVHQAAQPFTCVAVDNKDPANGPTRPDGRPCTQPEECLEDAPEPESDYVCEKVGLFGTTSIGLGRVRYTGIVRDPNELALTIALGVPLLLAFYEKRKGAFAALVGAAGTVAILICIHQTQSRGGVLVVLGVFGCLAVRDLKFQRLIYAAVLGAPLLLLGGRSGNEADSSTIERLECWYTGIMMTRESPLVGVGMGQFTEHHFLTAHNSYVLANAELGIVGGVLFVVLLYTAAKIPVVAFLRYRKLPEAKSAARTSFTLAASLGGAMIGVFFLSFCYHYVLWVYLGLSGALYASIRAHDRSFVVKIHGLEVALISVANVVVLMVLYVYTRSRI